MEAPFEKILTLPSEYNESAKMVRDALLEATLGFLVLSQLDHFSK